MSDAALEKMIGVVDELKAEVRELRELMATAEPLLRALLKKAPKRYHEPAPKPIGESPLTDEQKAEIWRKAAARAKR